MEQVYRLVRGVEGVGPIEGTLDELWRILDGYPTTFVLEVFAMEKDTGTELYPHIRRYAAMRFVDGFEAGEDDKWPISDR